VNSFRISEKQQGNEGDGEEDDSSSSPVGRRKEWLSDLRAMVGSFLQTLYNLQPCEVHGSAAFLLIFTVRDFSGLMLYDTELKE